MPWLRLLRLPNLFTAPGDSLAGYFLASAFIGNKTVSLWTIVLLAVTSVFIYAFGVVMNDLVDYQEDCIHRPERPLPSGRINRQQATWICVQLWIIASICCPGSSISIFLLHIDSNSLFVFVVLFITIALYNMWLKHYRLAGSIAMGLCRGLNFLLGVAATSYDSISFEKVWPVSVPFVAVTAYIAAVTWIADKENEEQNVGFVVQIPAIATALAWFGTVLPLSQKTVALAIPAVFLVLTVFLLEQTAGKLYHKTVPPKDMQKAIGALLRPLVFWQVTWILFSTTTAAYVVAALLVAGWFCAKALSQAIAQS
ncbi:MAG: UbiA family prenyltransferase [Victivallales bacterium]|nr:UbiA family prenyltransferase [Victivallales bacterium]MBR4372285.1 UbiA family prenyltransferase [Victivallales bacterium]